METIDIYAQYRDFWTLFSAAQKFEDRKVCSLRQWQARSPQARQAMIEHLKTHGAPLNRNPYFWIQDFPEPGLEPVTRAVTPVGEPTNYFGKPLPRGFEFFTAIHNGKKGLFTASDVQLYNMQDPQPFLV